MVVVAPSSLATLRLCALSDRAVAGSGVWESSVEVVSSGGCGTGTLGSGASLGSGSGSGRWAPLVFGFSLFIFFS